MKTEGIIIKKRGWKCFRCNHPWIPKEGFDKDNKPITCPRCRSAYWHRKRKEKKRGL